MNSKYINFEKGSALFLILIGVVLFAALSYSVAQMMRGGNPMMITEEKARLYADEILNYSRALRQATQNTRISGGCGALNVSFENASVTGYEHTPAASDACKIFHENGGAVNYISPSQDWLDMVYSPAPALRGQWVFPARICLPGLGNAATGCEADGIDNESLVAILPFVRKEVCAQLNTLLGINNPGGNPPPLDYSGDITVVLFNGTQADAVAVNTSNNMAGCYEGVPADTYHFYQVLLPR
jgi:hypothetical protein